MAYTNDLSKGDLKDIKRRLSKLEKASSINNSAIGRDGIEVYDGGVINISNGGLNVTGTATISGTLRATGNIDFTGTVGISGPLTIAGATNITGNTTVAGAFTTNGDLSVNGPTELNGVTDITGNTSVTGELTVTGPTTLDGILDIGGDTTVTGTLDVDGPTTISGKLDVTGAMATKGTLSAEGVTTLKNDLNVTTGGRIKAGVTEILPTGKAIFGDFVIDPNTAKLIQAPGGWLISNGADSIGLSSSASSSVQLSSMGAELNYLGKSFSIDHIGHRLTGSILQTTTNPPNVWVSEQGYLYRSTATA